MPHCGVDRDDIVIGVNTMVKRMSNAGRDRETGMMVGQWDSQQPAQPGAPQQPRPMPAKSEMPVDQGRAPHDFSRWWFVAHRRFSMVGAALCVAILTWYVLQALIGMALNAWLPVNTKLPLWLTLVVANSPLYFAAMPLAWLILSRIPVLATRTFKLGAGNFFTVLIICVPIVYVGSFIGTLLSSLLSSGSAVNEVSRLAMAGDPVTAFVFFVLVAPCFEEWMFRKQIIERTRRYGEKTAILLSAFAFALFHMNLFQFFYAFGMGLVFGYVYTRTSRLRYPILMHMVINFNGGVLAPWVVSHLQASTLRAAFSGSVQGSANAMAQDGVGLVVVLLYGLVMLGLIIAGIVLLITRRRRIEFYRSPEELPVGMRARTVLLNPGVVAYVLLCVCLIGLALYSNAG